MEGQSSAFLAFRGLYITLHAVIIVYIVGMLAIKFMKEGVRVTLQSKPALVYALAFQFSLFRILDLAIDPNFVYHRIPYWSRYLLLWLASVPP